MKHLLLLVVCLVISAVITGSLLTFYILHTNNHQQKIAMARAKATHFSIENPPPLSLKGNISSLSGTVSWQSRIATQPAEITAPQPIQQGEEIRTGNDGQATIQFPNLGYMIVSPGTELDMIQVLPTSAVIVQNQGSVTYHQTGTIPLAIRSLHLLTTISGDATITKQADEPIITVAVQKGSAKIGFNTLQYVSVVQEITEGQQLTFHDDTREFTM